MTFLSILHTEQRIIPNHELVKLLDLLNNTPYLQSSYESFIQFINRNFHLIPYRGTSRNFEEYFTERGFQLSTMNTEYSTTILLQIIIFYEAFIQWVNSDYNAMNSLYGYNIDLRWDNVHQDFIKKLEYITVSLLPALNYQITYHEHKNQYDFCEPLIIKRDSDVDSVLLLTDEIKVQVDLLNYLDFRLENNLQAKQDILARLYKTIIDDGKDTYSSPAKTDDFRLKYQNELYKQIKQIYNQTDIRHGGRGKVELTEEEKLKYCDMCFYLLLQLIRTPKSIEDMREIKQVFNPQK